MKTMKRSLPLLSLLVVVFFFLISASCSLSFKNDNNSGGSSGLNSNPLKATSFNYTDAFAKSILFYEANWCGPDAGSNRLPWRGPCHTSDGADVGLDLTGGFHDCGDHVKFGQTQAYAASTLGWAYYEFKDVFVSKGQDVYMLKILKHFTDYFLKSFPNANTFYYECGDGTTDHAYWGPPELQTTAITTRPTLYVANPTTPGSDVCGDTAAALALMYLNYLDKDSSYANKCLTAAKSLYTLGKTYLGLSQAGGFYAPSGYWDELSWGAVWLYLATTNTSYLNDVLTFMSNKNITDSNPYNNHWTHCWDDVWGGVFVKMAQITNRPLFKSVAEENLSYWMTGLTRTPGGLCYLNSWGNCRYVAAECMLALVYNKTATNQAYADFAKSQIDYILGNNPHSYSYEIGFGTSYPKFPHHRAASGRFEHQPANESKDDPERHLLYGALPGGPDSSDNYTDDVEQYVYTEVGIDYNAGLVGALAALTKTYGASQSPEATPGIESTNAPCYVTAYVMNEASDHSTIRAFFHNDSVLPPHYENQLSFRYFFNLSEYFAQGLNASAVTSSIFYSALSGGTLTAPTVWDDANHIYYVEASIAGSDLYGKAEFQFSLASYGAAIWDPSNDFSRTGLSTATNDIIATNIAVYRNGVKIFGNEAPKGATSSSTASSAAVSSSLAASSAASSVASSVASSAAVSSSLAASSVASSAAVSSSRSSAASSVVSSAASSAAISSSRSSVASSAAVSSSRSSVASSIAVSSSLAASSVASSTAASSGSGYAVNYTVNNDWGAGATCTVTIKNNSATALSSWSLVWTFAGNQQITQIWSAAQTTSGETVTAVNLSYNGTIGASGGTLSFGLNLSYSGANAKPTAFTLNGTACTLY